MEERIKLSYFYGKEAEQFSFYKIPKLLFTDKYFKGLSVEAKVLYGLMLDRMSLSVKNQWLDEEGRAYIYYSLDDIMEALACSNKKAIAIMKELDTDTGIGLIERKRQGQGKPAMIYLKQFMIREVQKCKNDTSGEKTEIPEVKNLQPNNTNINYTDISYTESNLIISDDGMGYDVEKYTKIIRENIELELLKESYPHEQELLDGIFDLILETVLNKNDTILISSNRYPAELVRDKFLKLNSMHIDYAIHCMAKNSTKVYNIKKYMLTILFNAPSTISGYYQAEVNHDYTRMTVNDR